MALHAGACADNTISSASAYMGQIVLLDEFAELDFVIEPQRTSADPDKSTPASTLPRTSSVSAN